MEGCCIVLAVSGLAGFLTQPRTTCLGNGTTVMSWALQHALSIKAIPHRHMPTSQSDEDDYSTETPVPDSLNCVRLTVVGNQDSAAP